MAEWYDDLSSGSKITISHTYQKTGKYTIILIARDEHGAFSYEMLENYQIKNKQRAINRLFFSDFPLLQFFLQRLNL